MHYAHKKAIWGSEISTFRTKTLHFFRVIRLNWLAKIELTGPLVFHIVVSYCCKQKMLKRNWNWRNGRLFWHIFVIGEISIGGSGFPTPPPLWLRLCSNCGKQKRCSQIFREVSGVFQQNFDDSKNSAVLEPRTEQFSRTWGFEAKDLRLRCQGQGLQNVFSRPRMSSRTPPLVTTSQNNNMAAILSSRKRISAA